MYRIRIILSILVLLTIITACQNDRNTIGTGLETELPIVGETFIDSLLSYSYDSEMIIYSGETSVLCSNHEEIESIVLMNFYNMPTEMDSLGDAILKFKINEDKSDFSIDNLTLGLIKRNWSETATWESPYPDSTDVTWDVTSELMIDRDYCSNSFSVEEDSLGITIPKDLIEDWVLEDINGYNLALIIDSGYILIQSSETSNGPNLSFDYKTDDETDEYSSECLYDTYIIEEKIDKQTYDNQLFLQNILPVRSFIGFDIDKAILNIPGINEDNKKFVLLNKAELVFTIDKENSAYYSEDIETYDELEVDILWPENEIDSPTVIQNDDLEASLDDIPYPYYLLESSTVELADSLATIDISPIVENYLKDRIDNHGFVLYNVDEDIFFGKISLYGFDATDELKPKLKVIYTIPEVE